MYPVIYEVGYRNFISVDNFFKYGVSVGVCGSVCWRAERGDGSGVVNANEINFEVDYW